MPPTTYHPPKRRGRVEREIADLREIGLDPSEIDLRDHFGEMDQVRSTLEDFDAVWVLGGNVVVLRTAFHESGADAVIADRLRDDSIVFAGYSARPRMLRPRAPRGMRCLREDSRAIPTRSSRPDWRSCRSPSHRTMGGSPAVQADPGADHDIDNHIPFIALRDGQALVINGEIRRVVE